MPDERHVVAESERGVIGQCVVGAFRSPHPETQVGQAVDESIALRQIHGVEFAVVAVGRTKG
jgi:hypothetical protein